MRIINCFPYFNERELLELRIRLLSDKIDLFIITDANKTHKGDPKPFTCKSTLEQLGLMSDKIQVVEVDLPDYQTEPNAWVRERMQRDSAAQFIQDDDVCFVTDCDEIIDPEFIEYYIDVSKKNPNNILRMPMAFLMGRGDLRVCDPAGNIIPWICPYVCLKHHINWYTLSEIRESQAWEQNCIKYTDLFTKQNGVVTEVGWHFSWMGDMERLKIKNKSFAHWDEVNVQENFIARENSTDSLGRNDHILKSYPTDLLPSLIFQHHNIEQFLLHTDKTTIQHIYQQEQFGENWFTYPNLYSRMVNQCNNNSKFIEVGSWKGKSSAYMAVEIANSNKQIEFICIDTWEGSIEHQNDPNLHNLYNIFKSNMSPLAGYYTEIKMKSLDAVKLFDDNSIDFVFIDASHEYEDVKNDILQWYPKIKVGGVLAGHDYYINSNFNSGVNRAVNELFTNFEVSEDCFIVKKV